MYLLIKQPDEIYAYTQATTKTADMKENETREAISTPQFKGIYKFGLYFLVC